MSGGISLCSNLWLSVWVVFRWPSNSLFVTFSDPVFSFVKSPFTNLKGSLQNDVLALSFLCVKS